MLIMKVWESTPGPNDHDEEGGIIFIFTREYFN